MSLPAEVRCGSPTPTVCGNGVPRRRGRRPAGRGDDALVVATRQPADAGRLDRSSKGRQARSGLPITEVMPAGDRSLEGIFGRLVQLHRGIGRAARARPAAQARYGPVAASPVGASCAVAGFQLAAAARPPRLAMAGAAATFPGGRDAGGAEASPASSTRLRRSVLLYVLCQRALQAGLLVTMCPAVSDELERGTWLHVAVRPAGRGRCWLGTFLCGRRLDRPAAPCSRAGSPGGGRTCRDPAGWGRPLPLLIVLSCIGRAALFSLPAVIVPKRALVASVGGRDRGRISCGGPPGGGQSADGEPPAADPARRMDGMDVGNFPSRLQLLVDTQPAAIQIVGRLHPGRRCS